MNFVWEDLAEYYIHTQSELDNLIKEIENTTKIFDPVYTTNLNTIALAISIGVIKYDVEYLNLLTPFEPIENKKYGGGESDKHVKLKYTGYHILKKHGEPTPEYESLGYDVWAPTLQIRLECGHTDVERLISAFKDGIRFWLIQYSNSDKVPLYKFYKTKKWDGFFSLYNKLLKERMLKMISRMRT